MHSGQGGAAGHPAGAGQDWGTELAAYISVKQSAELQREIRRREKKLTVLNQRARDLDAIFKRLYADSVLGRITVEQFQALSGSYTEERAALKENEVAIQALREQVCGANHFIALAKKYTDIQELPRNCCSCSSGRSWCMRRT